MVADNRKNWEVSASHSVRTLAVRRENEKLVEANDRNATCMSVGRRGVSEGGRDVG